MKKIILTIICILCIGGAIYYYNQKQPVQNSKLDKMKWCYGVYHETKSSIEMRDHDIWIHFSPIYKDMEESRPYKQGKSSATKATKEQRTECYDMVYPMLAELQKEKGNLNDSVPYCFGYLEKAREGSYISTFCQQKCQRVKKDNCLSICQRDLEQNLKEQPLNQGKQDAENRVNPAQFVHCIEVLKSIM